MIPRSAAWREHVGGRLRGHAEEDEIQIRVGDLVERSVDLLSQHLVAEEVGAVERALEPRGAQVVIRDEPEFSGMGRSAGHHDAARLEERAEPFGRLADRHGASRISCRSRSLRAITIFWTSLVPSPMIISGESR